MNVSKFLLTAFSIAALALLSSCDDGTTSSLDETGEAPLLVAVD